MAGIRDNLVRKAVGAGIQLDQARWANRDACSPLSHAEKMLARRAVSGALLRWFEANEPDGGPEQYIDEALAEARQSASQNGDKSGGP